MKKHPLSPVAVLVALTCSTVHAQQATLPSVVVTGSPIIESNQVDAFSGFSTRVTDTQVKELGALDLAAALRMTPGVQISRYNEVGSYSGDQGGNVYIRGLGASRPGSEIKTYLDGIPLYMGVWNHPLMDLLPLNGIRSVDVQKGPQNQVSGNNFAAIHLGSKRAAQEGSETEVNASLGSYASRVLQVNTVGRQGNLDYAIAAGHVESNGARPNGDGTLSNAMGRLSIQLDKAWSVGASFLSVNNKVGDPGDTRYAPFTATARPNAAAAEGLARNDSETNLVSFFVTHQHADWTGELKVYENRGHNNIDKDTGWGTFDSNFKMSGLRWKEEFSPWKGGRLVGGVDQESVSGAVTGPHVGGAMGVAGSADVPSFRVTSVFAGLSHNVQLSNAWVMQPSVGLRAYSSNHFGSKSAPNAGVSFISENVTVYANYTQALLYPGAETYTLTKAIPFMFAADSQWNRLVPTEDRHSEMGLKLALGAGTQLDLSVFNDDIKNRYVWSGTFGSSVWSNGFAAYRVNGVEASLKHRFNSQWSWFGGVTSLNASLSDLPYAPQTAVSVGVNGQLAGYQLTVDAQHQSGMYSLTQSRKLTDSATQVDAFTVANMRLAKPVAALGKKGEVYLAVNNLFDANYQYNAGYPMPGRNFRAGLTASF